MNTFSIKTDNARRPVVNVVGSMAAGAGMARVICDIVHTENSRKAPEEVRQAMQAAFKGKLRPVEGSFKVLSSNALTERVLGLVSTVRKVLPCGEEAPKGFTAMAANVFMDDEHEMWKLQTTQAGNLLVHSPDFADDSSLAELLLSVSSNRISPSEKAILRATCSAISSEVEGGNYVSYVSDCGTLEHGFVAACTDDGQAVVLPHASQREDVVALGAITEIHDINDLPEVPFSDAERVQMSLSAATPSLAAILEYYKKVFARRPEYFDEFETRLRQGCHSL